jgi:hypothetical protein
MRRAVDMSAPCRDVAVSFGALSSPRASLLALARQVEDVGAVARLRRPEELAERLVRYLRSRDVARRKGGLQSSGEAREEPGPWACARLRRRRGGSIRGRAGRGGGGCHGRAAQLAYWERRSLGHRGGFRLARSRNPRARIAKSQHARRDSNP